MNGAEFVERIDLLLKEKNLKRQTLADSVGFDSSTLAQWKTKDRLPDIQTAYEIALFLHVSLDWLIMGKLSQGWDQSIHSEQSPKKITIRIQNEIEAITSNFNKYDENFYSIILDCVSFEEIVAWSTNRLEPSIYKLSLISEKLTISLQYLLTGIDPRLPNVDQHVIRLADKYPSHLKFYDCLSESDQKTINRATEGLFYLTRKQE